MSGFVAPPDSGNRFSLSILSTYSSDSTPSMLVAFDSQRYLFNTPEAISRIALQSKVGLRKVSNVFLGSIEESAGLPGFVLSTVEAGNNKIEVVGPEGTEHYLASCRFFTRRDKLSLQIKNPSQLDSGSAAPRLPSPIISDSNLNVYAFPLSSSVQHRGSDAPFVAHSPGSPPPSLKRKRSGSFTPPGRPKSPPIASQGSPDRQAVAGSPPGSESTPFQPSRLTGHDADRWRKMVLKDMFRGNAFASSVEEVRKDLPTIGQRNGPTPAYLPQALPPFRGDAKQAVSYLLVGPVQVGKFLPEEAVKRGVAPGKMFAKLKKGERVWVRTTSESTKTKVVEIPPTEGESPRESKKERARRLKEEKLRQEEQEKDLVDGEGEGHWVEPEDCTEPGQDASAFLILNVPSVRHIAALSTTIPPALLTSNHLGPSTSLKTIFYFVGPSVSTSPEFVSYVDSLRALLPSSVDHYLSCADDVAAGKDDVTFGPSTLLNLRLSKLDAKMFSIPRYSRSTSSTHASTGLSLLSSNAHFTSTGVLLPPTKNPLGGEVRSIDFEIGSEKAELEASRLKGVDKPRDIQDRAKAAWKAYLSQTKVARDDVKALGRTAAKKEELTNQLAVTPLGTGSAIPSKYRNVSSTLLHLSTSSTEKGSVDYVMLDAGEGTWGQLARRFGRRGEHPDGDGAEDVLRKLKLIFISHLHQDHHAGLATLLKKRALLKPQPSSPLTIVAPSNARTYLFEQSQLLDLGLSASTNVRFIDNFLLEPGKSLTTGSRVSADYDNVLDLLDLKAITAVPVLHRCRAWGVVITHRSGWRVVFSGDTMPCDALVEHGQDASLLIHEATIEDNMPEVALAKGHSTFAQAIDIGTRMRARHLLLTHFSARYPKLPPLSSSATSENLYHPVVATAFDLMTLPLSEFWKLERYRPALDALLSWDEVDEADKSDLDLEKPSLPGTAESEAV